MTYGRLKVQLLSEQDCGDFVIRKLEMGEADSHYQVPVCCIVDILTSHLGAAPFWCFSNSHVVQVVIVGIQLPFVAVPCRN